MAPLLTPFTKRSNNQIPAVEVLLAWFYGLAVGIELARLPAGHRVELVRADAGFYETAVLEALEAQDLP